METPPRITMLLYASRESEHAGDLPAAIRQAQEALALAQQAGDGDAQGLAAAALAYAHIRLGHYTVARALLEQTLPVTTPESAARGEVLLTLGICAAETDDVAAAETYFQQSIDLGRQLGVMRLLVRGLHSLAAGVYTPRGEFPLAIAADEEALKLARAHHFPELVWSQLTNLTWTCWLMGQRDRALHWLTELREIALPGTLADGYWYLIHGELAREDSNFVQANQYFANAAPLPRPVDYPNWTFSYDWGWPACVVPKAMPPPPFPGPPMPSASPSARATGTCKAAPFLNEAEPPGLWKIGGRPKPTSRPRWPCCSRSTLTLTWRRRYCCSRVCSTRNALQRPRPFG